jgi:TonB family protein
VTRAPRLPPFETALLLSLLFHVALWGFFAWKRGLEAWVSRDVIELDLTRPFRLTDDPALARRAENPGTGAPVAAVPTPPAPVPAPVEPALKEWVLPGPDTKELIQPTTAETPGPTGLGGLGDGGGDGEVDWVYLTDLPRLLNREELARGMRRHYPEARRRDGVEGWVSLDVHIDRGGRVTGVQVVQASERAFEEAGKKVIRAARFSPAKAGHDVVPVKIRQTVHFRLEDE